MKNLMIVMTVLLFSGCAGIESQRLTKENADAAHARMMETPRELLTSDNTDVRYTIWTTNQSPFYFVDVIFKRKLVTNKNTGEAYLKNVELKFAKRDYNILELDNLMFEKWVVK